jgi:hypothetical protein
MGEAEVRGFYEAAFEAFGSPPLEFHEVLWDGDTAAIRFTMGGRHAGEFMGVKPTGVEIALPGITILRFEGDRVVERHSQADVLVLLVQLGARLSRDRGAARRRRHDGAPRPAVLAHQRGEAAAAAAHVDRPAARG